MKKKKNDKYIGKMYYNNIQVIRGRKEVNVIEELGENRRRHTDEDEGLEEKGRRRIRRGRRRTLITNR